MKKNKTLFKKIVSTALCCSMLASVGFLLTGCGKKQSGPVDLNVKQMYALAVTAGASYYDDGISASNLTAEAQANSNAQRPAVVADDIENLNNYVQMFEGYLMKNETNVSASQVTAEFVNDQANKTHYDFADGTSYDITEHSIKQVITLPSLKGDNVVYTMYYTEQAVNGGEYVEANDDDEVEIETQLKGVLVYANGDAFKLQGTRTTEQEKDEYESEIEFFIKKSATDYIVMSHSVEVESNENENEFEFELYEGGNLVSSTSVEFEKEKDELKMELEFNEDVAAAQHVVYELKYEKVNNKNKLKVNYKASTEMVSFVI